MGLFREPSSLKETQNANIPGAKSFHTPGEHEVSELETNLHGKNLKEACCPVVWKCVWWTDCTRRPGMRQLLCLAHAQVLLRPQLLTVPGTGGRGSQKEQRKHRLNNQEKKINCAEWQLVFRKQAV